MRGPGSDHRLPDASADPLALAYVGSVAPTAMLLGSPAYSPAGTGFQSDLLQHLTCTGAAAVEAFAVRPVAAFPRERVLAVRGTRVQLDRTGTAVRLVPFVNVRGAKEVTVAAALAAHLVGWALRHRRGPRALLVYNTFSPLALPVLATARASRIPAVAIVADLPVTPGVRGVRGVLERAELRAQLALLRRFDGLVVLTRHIAEDFAPGVPWILMEGAVGADDAAALPASGADPSGRGETVVMYSGMLNEMNGIPLLLDAFARIAEPGWRLWVYGGGPLTGQVQAAARRDARIEYHSWDTVSADELRRRQRQATLLVNPRLPSHPSNRYSFPSKLMGYLTSGTPTVSTAIPGIPEEYHPYLELTRSETPEDMAGTMRRVAALRADERVRRGARARDWVLRHKRWTRQAERVGDFLRDLAGRAPAAPQPDGSAPGD